MPRSTHVPLLVHGTWSLMAFMVRQLLGRIGLFWTQLRMIPGAFSSFQHKATSATWPMLSCGLGMGRLKYPQPCMIRYCVCIQSNITTIFKLLFQERNYQSSSNRYHILDFVFDLKPERALYLLLMTLYQWPQDHDLHVCFYYLQLYTIHVIVHEESFPLVYCLLPDRTKATYRRMFQALKGAMATRRLQLRLRCIQTDYEISLMSAAKEEFLGKCHIWIFIYNKAIIYII